MKIYCLSLGCAKNKVDSERLVGALAAAGHEIVASARDAECAVVNTCAFIRPAVEESVSAVLDLEELKKEKKIKKIAVVGCLVNRYGKELTRELPAVDYWAKSEAWDELLERMKTPFRCGSPRQILPSSSPYSRYLKISEGCGNKCSYCAIPSIRGPLRSVPLRSVVKEAESLVEDGAKELCVVGQDLTVYGQDGGTESLSELLDALESSLPHDIWIRLLYLHPSRVDVPLLSRVANGRQILPYLDVPVQHGDAEILSKMNRSAPPERLIGIFRTAREISPDFALRTTCMVGFPGEKRRHFDNLLKFIREVRFDRMGAFTFFPEEGTPAAEMERQVAERTKKSRLAELMREQEEISASRQERFVGRVLKTLVEKVYPNEGYAEGRSFREAPEVDGVIEITNVSRGLRAGDFVNVRVTAAGVHDMAGEAI